MVEKRRAQSAGAALHGRSAASNDHCGAAMRFVMLWKDASADALPVAASGCLELAKAGCPACVFGGPRGLGVS